MSKHKEEKRRRRLKKIDRIRGALKSNQPSVARHLALGNHEHRVMTTYRQEKAQRAAVLQEKKDKAVAGIGQVHLERRESRHNGEK